MWGVIPFGCDMTNRNRSEPGEQRRRHQFSRRTWLKLAAAGITVPASAATSASAAESFLDVLSIDPSNYPTVLLNISVDTAAGRNGDLTETNFTVIEGGEERDLADVSFGSAKSDIVFVFDDSGSLGGEIADLKRKVTDLVSEIEAAAIDARYGLVTFKDRVEVDLELTDDADALESSVNALTASGGGDFPEDNFDAIVEALGLEFRADAQKVLIDITDAVSHYRGDGSGFSEFTIDEVASRLTDSGVAYIAVSPGFTNERAAKKELAEQVDGTYIDITDGDFSVILEEVIRLIVTAYTVEYITSLVAGATAPLSVIVDDPEAGTSRVDSTVEVPTDVVDANIPGLIDDKRDQIAAVRSAARPVLSAEPAGGFPSVTLSGADQLDTEAHRYLASLDPDDDGEPDLGETDPVQTAEALERLVNIESVTENAVRAPIRDTGSGPLIQRQVDAAIDVIKTLAFEVITRGAGRAASSAISRAVSDDIIQGVLDEVNSIRRSLSATGYGGAGPAGRGLSRSADDQRVTFDELDSRYQDDVLARRDSQEKFVEGGASSLAGGTLSLASDFFAEIDQTARAVDDVLVQLEYQKYLNGAPGGNLVDLLDGLAEFDPPTIDLSAIPDTVDVPVPGSDLGNEAVDGVEDATNGFIGFIDDTTDDFDNVDELQGINFEQTSDISLSEIPEEVTLDLLEELPEEIDLGELPGVDEIQELADLAAEVRGVLGTAIDPTIDQIAERLAEDAAAGSLNRQAQADREAVLETASTVIEAVIDTTDTALDGLRTLSEGIDAVETALGILVAVAAVIGLAATGGVGSVLAIAVLGALSTIAVAVSIAVDSLRYVVAQQARQAIGASHSAAGGLITYTDLSTIGGGR